MLTFLRVHVGCASLIGVLAPRLRCLVISLKPPVISPLIIVQSDLFLSPNANHPIGLPHTPIICPIHPGLAVCNCCSRAFFVSFFVFFSFCFMRFIIHRFMLPVSIQLVRVESISPRQANRSALSTPRITHTTYSLYHKFYEPIRTHAPQPTLRQSGYKCFT